MEPSALRLTLNTQPEPIAFSPGGSSTSSQVPLKSVIFAIGWKGEAQADLEQAKTHKHQHQTNTNLKNTNHTF